jgi:hypothetical protein
LSSKQAMKEWWRALRALQKAAVVVIVASTCAVVVTAVLVKLKVIERDTSSAIALATPLITLVVGTFMVMIPSSGATVTTATRRGKRRVSGQQQVEDPDLAWDPYEVPPKHLAPGTVLVTNYGSSPSDLVPSDHGTLDNNRAEVDGGNGFIDDVF